MRQARQNIEGQKGKDDKDGEDLEDGQSAFVFLVDPTVVADDGKGEVEEEQSDHQDLIGDGEKGEGRLGNAVVAEDLGDAKRFADIDSCDVCHLVDGIGSQVFADNVIERGQARDDGRDTDQIENEEDDDGEQANPQRLLATDSFGFWSGHG